MRFVEHPEALPSADMGLGTLAPSAGVELDFGAGPLDLLALDRSGRPVVVEFKKGTENPTFARSSHRCSTTAARYGVCHTRRGKPGPRTTGSATLIPKGLTLAEHVADRLTKLGEPFDPTTFEQGLRPEFRS